MLMEVAASSSSSSSSSSSVLIYGFRGPRSSRSHRCLVSPANPTSLFLPRPPPPRHLSSRRRFKSAGRTCASISASPELRTSSDDLVASILSKVAQSDRGILLTKEENNNVAELAQELQRYCVSEPVKCPLIFGDWDVVYCSVPTSPGGGYRSALGRFFLKTKEMVQAVNPPNIVINKVCFSAFGFIDGEVCLKGKLKALDEKWIQVVFEPPELKFGAWDFKYGGESEVKLEITYVDEKIRLGKGSKGSLFVFERRLQAL